MIRLIRGILLATGVAGAGMLPGAALAQASYDAASKTIIAHWMDSFGAKYSVPHGSGDIAGNVITFTIPYPSGPFRNTWRFDPAGATWRRGRRTSPPIPAR